MITAIIILLGVILLCVPVNKRLYWKYSAFVFMLVAAGYFFFEPSSELDLYRHYSILNDVRNYGIDTFDTAISHYWEENPLFIILLFIVSFVPINAFLPFLIGSIYYIATLYGVKLVSKDQQVDIISKVGIISALLTINYISFSGIRQSLSCAIFLFALYLDFIKHKKISVVLYVFSALMHSVGFLYILIRVLCFVYQRYSKYLAILFTAVISYIFFGMSEAIVGLLSNIPLLANAVIRLQMYTIEGKGTNEISINWYLLTISTYIFLYLLAWYYERHFDHKKKYQGFFGYFTLMLIFTFTFINQRDIFNRQMMILLPIGILFSVLLGQSTFKKFPFIISTDTKSYNTSLIASFLYYIFIIWALLYYVLVSALSYPVFDKNYFL
jgi:hypothetical protein